MLEMKRESSAVRGGRVSSRERKKSERDVLTGEESGDGCCTVDSCSPSLSETW